MSDQERKQLFGSNDVVSMAKVKKMLSNKRYMFCLQVCKVNPTKVITKVRAIYIPKA